MNIYIQETEQKWKDEKIVVKNSPKFNEYTQKVLEDLQKLNNELRKMSELKDETFKKNVNFLLNLEQQKYKMTLSLYINKLNCF